MWGGGLNSYIIQGRGLRLSICATPARKILKTQRRPVMAALIHCRPMDWQSDLLAEIEAAAHIAGVNDNDQPCLS